tara:strand:- start:21 stop:368 length:348 start_codon:yes stop_codon:yes gene_type:complete
MANESCIFCDLKDSTDPNSFLFDDEYVFALRDINPRAPVHILIIPKNHIVDVSRVRLEDEQTLSHMFAASTEIAISEGVNETGYRLAINKGKDANMTVNHLHMHLMGGRTLGAEG